MLAIGMLVWMSMMPIIEAAEQTVLQRVVPFDHQGRVFGFAQTIENAASPLTAFMIGPLAQYVFIPTMRDGGTGADWIGGWFGVGSERGLALDVHPRRADRHRVHPLRPVRPVVPADLGRLRRGRPGGRRLIGLCQSSSSERRSRIAAQDRRAIARNIASDASLRVAVA